MTSADTTFPELAGYERVESKPTIAVYQGLAAAPGKTTVPGPHVSLPGTNPALQLVATASVGLVIAQ